jgi:dienelactone hydrolase
MTQTSPIRLSIATLVLTTVAATAAAQWPPFGYPAPAPGTVAETRDVAYDTAGDVTLRMDVFRPSKPAPAEGRPALIFFNRTTGADRANAFYGGWARAAAGLGVVGILPDLRDDSPAQDFDRLVAHLTARAADYGIDRRRIAVYAASGNAWTALPLLQDPKRTGVAAVVLYYGSGEVNDFRPDLPMLWVRAGLDRPALNRAITDLAARAMTQNAPLTLLNYPGGYHGFESRNPDEAMRQVVDQTIAFVNEATAPAYQAALRASLKEATAAGLSLSGRHGEAVTLYADLVAARPNDATLHLAYGESLLADAQFARACATFETLKGKGLGARDLGLPAARACLQKGDPDAAIAWLKSIPSRFLPASVADDPVFAPLRQRADFKALFGR